MFLAGIGRDPHRHPGTDGGESDPASPRVLAVVVRE